jgi:hypothetical protein
VELFTDANMPGSLVMAELQVRARSALVKRRLGVGLVIEREGRERGGGWT